MEANEAVVACKAPGERLRLLTLEETEGTLRWSELVRQGPGEWVALSSGATVPEGSLVASARELLTSRGFAADAVEVPAPLLVELLEHDGRGEAHALAYLLDLLSPSVRDPGLEQELPRGVDAPADLAALVSLERAVREAPAEAEGTSWEVTARLPDGTSVTLAAEPEEIGSQAYHASATIAYPSGDSETLDISSEGGLREGPSPLPTLDAAAEAAQASLASLALHIAAQREERERRRELAERREGTRQRTMGGL